MWGAGAIFERMLPGSPGRERPQAKRVALRIDGGRLRVLVPKKGRGPMTPPILTPPSLGEWD